MKAVVENYQTDATFDLLQAEALFERSIADLKLEKIPIASTTYFLNETHGIVEYKERVK